MLPLVTPDAKDKALSETAEQLHVDGCPAAVQELKLGVKVAQPIHDGPGFVGPKTRPVAVIVLQIMPDTLAPGPVAVIMNFGGGALMVNIVPPAEPLVVQLVAEAADDDASVETRTAPSSAVRRSILDIRSSLHGPRPHRFMNRRGHRDREATNATVIRRALSHTGHQCDIGDASSCRLAVGAGGPPDAALRRPSGGPPDAGGSHSRST
jgi:hypothetical protein